MPSLSQLIRGFFPPVVPLWVKVLFALAIGLIALANFFFFRIVHDINSGKPLNDRDSYVLWYPQKWSRVWTEYERRFPNGRNATYYKASLLAGVLTFFLWFFLSIWYASTAY